MGFSHSTVREQLGRFWPFFILLFMAILYLIHLDLSMSRMLSSNDTRKLQGQVETMSIKDIHEKQPLPYAIILALVHYATTPITPQQTREEIMITANILSQKAPCNFLIFGLGYDSLLWQSLNHGGNTLFLEEDPNWIAEMERSNPELRAVAVNYTKMVSNAKELLSYARTEKNTCSPAIDLQKSECKLAMKGLPAEVYEENWDVVMIDAPRGYFDEAPGRMSAIFSSAVMAKGKGKKESTHILLHDVDRSVEKEFSIEFFCSKNLIEAVGKLWHFQIYGEQGSSSPSPTHDFCRNALSKTNA